MASLGTPQQAAYKIVAVAGSIAAAASMSAVKIREAAAHPLIALIVSSAESQNTDEYKKRGKTLDRTVKAAKARSNQGYKKQFREPEVNLLAGKAEYNRIANPESRKEIRALRNLALGRPRVPSPPCAVALQVEEPNVKVKDKGEAESSMSKRGNCLLMQSLATRCIAGKVPHPQPASFLNVCTGTRLRATPEAEEATYEQYFDRALRVQEAEEWPKHHSVHDIAEWRRIARAVRPGEPGDTIPRTKDELDKVIVEQPSSAGVHALFPRGDFELSPGLSYQKEIWWRLKHVRNAVFGVWGIRVVSQVEEQEARRAKYKTLKGEVRRALVKQDEDFAIDERKERDAIAAEARRKQKEEEEEAERKEREREVERLCVIPDDSDDLHTHSSGENIKAENVDNSAHNNNSSLNTDNNNLKTSNGVSNTSSSGDNNMNASNDHAVNNSNDSNNGKPVNNTNAAVTGAGPTFAAAPGSERLQSVEQPACHATHPPPHQYHHYQQEPPVLPHDRQADHGPTPSPVLPKLSMTPLPPLTSHTPTTPDPYPLTPKQTDTLQYQQHQHQLQQQQQQPPHPQLQHQLQPHQQQQQQQPQHQQQQQQQQQQPHQQQQQQPQHQFQQQPHQQQYQQQQQQLQHQQPQQHQQLQLQPQQQLQSQPQQHQQLQYQQPAQQQQQQHQQLHQSHPQQQQQYQQQHDQQQRQQHQHMQQPQHHQQQHQLDPPPAVYPASTTLAAASPGSLPDVEARHYARGAVPVGIDTPTSEASMDLENKELVAVDASAAASASAAPSGTAGRLRVTFSDSVPGTIDLPPPAHPVHGRLSDRTVGRSAGGSNALSGASSALLPSAFLRPQPQKLSPQARLFPSAPPGPGAGSDHQAQQRAAAGGLAFQQQQPPPQQPQGAAGGHPQTIVIAASPQPADAAQKLQQRSPQLLTVKEEESCGRADNATAASDLSSELEHLEVADQVLKLLTGIVSEDSPRAATAGDTSPRSVTPKTLQQQQQLHEQQSILREKLQILTETHPSKKKGRLRSSTPPPATTPSRALEQPPGDPGGKVSVKQEPDSTALARPPSISSSSTVQEIDSVKKEPPKVKVERADPDASPPPRVPDAFFDALKDGDKKDAKPRGDAKKDQISRVSSKATNGKATLQASLERDGVEEVSPPLSRDLTSVSSSVSPVRAPVHDAKDNAGISASALQPSRSEIFAGCEVEGLTTIQPQAALLTTDRTLVPDVEIAPGWEGVVVRRLDSRRPPCVVVKLAALGHLLFLVETAHVRVTKSAPKLPAGEAAVLRFPVTLPSGNDAAVGDGGSSALTLPAGTFVLVVANDARAARAGKQAVRVRLPLPVSGMRSPENPSILRKGRCKWVVVKLYSWQLQVVTEYLQPGEEDASVGEEKDVEVLVSKRVCTRVRSVVPLDVWVKGKVGVQKGLASSGEDWLGNGSEGSLKRKRASQLVDDRGEEPLVVPENTFGVVSSVMHGQSKAPSELPFHPTASGKSSVNTAPLTSVPFPVSQSSFRLSILFLCPALSSAQKRARLSYPASAVEREEMSDSSIDSTTDRKPKPTRRILIDVEPWQIEAYPSDNPPCAAPGVSTTNGVKVHRSVKRNDPPSPRQRSLPPDKPAIGTCRRGHKMSWVHSGGEWELGQSGYQWHSCDFCPKENFQGWFLRCRICNVDLCSLECSGRALGERPLRPWLLPNGDQDLGIDWALLLEKSSESEEANSAAKRYSFAQVQRVISYQSQMYLAAQLRKELHHEAAWAANGGGGAGGVAPANGLEAPASEEYLGRCSHRMLQAMCKERNISAQGSSHALRCRLLDMTTPARLSLTPSPVPPTKRSRSKGASHAAPPAKKLKRKRL
ncbi:hypothetical protein DIPPA_13332 [Diplonema papillatum]|nr:hypothetical protein DIPPA_13332 [Diplonema papillatum]